MNTKTPHPLSRRDFPADFLWGAATSAHQIEGNNIHNDWWAWEQAGKTESGDRSGRATDHWNRFREDLRLARDLGLNTYRFSIEWSRIEPAPGQTETAALDWYAELIAECERLGLKPMATLHHFTSPQWFAEKGGFTRPGASNDFLKYVEVVVARLGSRIPLWCTLNEPNVLAVGSYLIGFMPPARMDPHGAAHAQSELLRAHALAYDRIHSISKREGPWANTPIEVGLALNTMDFLPAREWNPLEHFLASRIHRFYNQAWLDAVTGRGQDFGLLHLVPSPAQVSEAHGRRTADFVGVNYYTKGYVRLFPQKRESAGLSGAPVELTFAKPGEPASDMDWAVHPDGFRKLLAFAARYELPIHITENGIADAADRLRPDFLQSHLGVVRDLIRQGLPIRSYYHWSLLDNFEWTKGFGPRFGLFRVNYDTLERQPTQAALWLRDFLSAAAR